MSENSITIPYKQYRGGVLHAKYECSCGETHIIREFQDTHFHKFVANKPVYEILGCGRLVGLTWRTNGKLEVSDEMQEVR